MGRIKTKLTKRVTHELVEKHRNKLSDNFEENKKVVNENTNVSSKKLRNIIAGYAARLVKQEQQEH